MKNRILFILTVTTICVSTLPAAEYTGTEGTVLLSIIYGSVIA